MAVSYVELIYPDGQLQVSMFPEEDLETLVTAWLSEGTEKASEIDSGLRDEAVRDWVYYRAYSAIADRLAMTPDQASADGMSRSISSSRIEHFRDLARIHLDQFKAAQTSSGSKVTRKRTTSVDTQVYF